MPDVNYVPSLERLLMRDARNKQAAGTGAELTEFNAMAFQDALARAYGAAEAEYQLSLKDGVPKELARCLIPVGRYSRMRASANLWNWLHFLRLRMDAHAQWEIRQYANVVGEMVSQAFPRTWTLFSEGLAK